MEPDAGRCGRSDGRSDCTSRPTPKGHSVSGTSYQSTRRNCHACRLGKRVRLTGSVWGGGGDDKGRERQEEFVN